MNSKIKSAVLSVVIVGLLAVSGVAFAQVSAQNPVNLPASPVTDVTGAVGILQKVVQWVYVIFFILAVLFILFAAFTYLTAAGDDEKIAKAKNQIIYAAVAIIVALLAVGFQSIVASFLTSSVPV